MILDCLAVVMPIMVWLKLKDEGHYIVIYCYGSQAIITPSYYGIRFTQMMIISCESLNGWNPTLSVNFLVSIQL